MSSTQHNTILIVPGVRDHVAEHWQTLLEEQLRASGVPVHSVPPLENDKLNCAARVAAFEHALAAIAGSVIVVAHSGGVLVLAHWALTDRHERIRGALLATPPDFDSPLPAAYPTQDILRANGWLPIPRARLPFPSIVAASSNDALATPEAVAAMARDWGAELVDLGPVGHLNPASGHGPWPQALDFIARLDR